MNKILPTIGEVDFNQVRPRDTILVKFGFVYLKAIIKRVTDTGIVFTCPHWLKRENTFLSYDEILHDSRKLPPLKYGRYSKFRWWIKF